MKQLYLILSIFCFQLSIAQSVKIIDSETNEAIPFANIRINSETFVSNAEGYFSIPFSADADSNVEISYIGYRNLQVPIHALQKQDYIVKMAPATYSLDTVIVPNKRPDPQQIMAEVKKRLKDNYLTDQKPLKNTIFYRQTTSFKPSKFDFEIDKSSGFTSKQLATTNRDLEKYAKSLISHPPQQFTDVLCNYYSAFKQKDGKPTYEPKLEVIKATKLSDEKRSTDIAELQKGLGKIVLQHLDTTKYYRIKSGWFGSRDTISLRKGFTNKNQKPRTKVSSSKSSLMSFMVMNNPVNGRVDFITNHMNYDFEYEGALYSAENEFIYVLNFKPRKSKAKYTGKIYVSETDYAVVRTDYTLGEGKKLSGVNLKLILGVKSAENVSNGTLIYKKGTNSEKYYLQYAAVEDGQYIYINRPIKFIELSDEEKDVVAFDLKVEVNTFERMEFLNISRETITENAFDQYNEQDFAYIPLKAYNPELWKEYGVIEPVEEMKRFKVAEQ
ncbi:MAG: carboxypeptidase-like regulatory domain-containing protein [Flavobacterium sp.]|nr:carboxypeptidase-like regulatory domain-containing protein [Flavobacterium sp.]